MDTEAAEMMQDLLDALEKETTDNPYRRVWSQAIGEFKNTQGGGPNEANEYARQVVGKVWLAHLWHRWRTAEGLSASFDNDPDAKELLAQFDALNVEDFNWEEA